MRPSRLIRLAGITVGGILGGIVAAVVAAVGVVVLVIWVATDSPSEHARKAVQADFDAVARVSNCRRVRVDEEASIYRCSVTTTSCSRSYLFLVPKLYRFTPAPYRKPGSIFDRPCAYRSDGPA